MTRENWEIYCVQLKSKFVRLEWELWFASAQQAKVDKVSQWQNKFVESKVFNFTLQARANEQAKVQAVHGPKVQLPKSLHLLIFTKIFHLLKPIIVILQTGKLALISDSEERGTKFPVVRCWGVKFIAIGTVSSQVRYSIFLVSWNWKLCQHWCHFNNLWWW